MDNNIEPKKRRLQEPAVANQVEKSVKEELIRDEGTVPLNPSYSLILSLLMLTFSFLYPF